MGLDMYLTKRTYVSRLEQEKSAYTYPKGIKPERVNYIIEEVGYWRKANAIHKWFVENVQGGEDDCKPYGVDVVELEKLLSTVKQVLASTKLIEGKVTNGYTYTKEKGEQPIIQDGKLLEDATMARVLLPTGEGFFFGSQDYDEWYWADLKLTEKILTNVLAELKENPNADIYYQSSW